MTPDPHRARIKGYGGPEANEKSVGTLLEFYQTLPLYIEPNDTAPREYGRDVLFTEKVDQMISFLPRDFQPESAPDNAFSMIEVSEQILGFRERTNGINQSNIRPVRV